MCVRAQVCLCVNMSVRVFLCVYIYMCVCVCVFVCVFCACVYTMHAVLRVTSQYNKRLPSHIQDELLANSV